MKKSMYFFLLLCCTQGLRAQEHNYKEASLIAAQNPGFNEEASSIPVSHTQKKAISFGNLGWQAYQEGDYEQCISLSREALMFDNTLGWVQCNIALAYLVTNKPGATPEYIKAIGMVSRSPRARHYLQLAIKGIADAQSKGAVKDADNILFLLMEEYKKYAIVKM